MRVSSAVLVPSGSVILDGKKTATYLSYIDENESELEFRTRHQKVIQSFLYKIGEKNEYLSREDVSRVFLETFSSSLGRRAAVSLLNELRKLDADHLILKAVHGDEVVVDEQVLT